MVTITPEDLDTVTLTDQEIAVNRLYMSQTATLPKFKGKMGESWQAFESTFRLRWANSALDSFQLDTQKGAILGSLEGPATRAHTLLAKGTEGWRTSTSMNEFLTKVKEVFNPLEESALSRISFERIQQRLEEPITEY